MQNTKQSDACALRTAKRKELKTRKLLDRKAYRIEEYTEANHFQLRFAAIGEN